MMQRNWSEEVEADVVSSALADARLLDSGFELIPRILGVRRCSLMLFDASRHELVLVRVWGAPSQVTIGTRASVDRGVAGWVLRHRTPALVDDVTRDPRFPQESRLHYETRSCISVPVVYDQVCYGVLNATDKLDGTTFTATDLATLELFASHIALCIHHEQLMRELGQLANTDSLTGLFNRRYFLARLAEEVDRAARYQHSLCLLMLDLDAFKRLNDTYGHRWGDTVIQRMAQLLRETVRRVDIVCRYGGDELAVILPETEVDEAEVVARRLTRAVQLEVFATPGQGGERVTVSGGISAYPSLATTVEELIDQADQAMYRAKQRGGSTIYIWGSEEPRAVR
ncbi:MAG TPA: sensor domain-containing diguanylate cyclase [Chloroflexota bacterium]